MTPTTVIITAATTVAVEDTATRDVNRRNNLRHSSQQLHMKNNQQLEDRPLMDRGKQRRRQQRQRRLGGKSSKRGKSSKSKAHKATYHYSDQSRDGDYGSGDSVVDLGQVEMFTPTDDNEMKEEDSSGMKDSDVEGKKEENEEKDMSLPTDVHVSPSAPSSIESASIVSISAPSSSQDQGDDAKAGVSFSAPSSSLDQTSTSNSNANDATLDGTDNNLLTGEIVVEQKLTAPTDTEIEPTFVDGESPPTQNTAGSENVNVQSQLGNKSRTGVIAALSLGSLAFLTLGLFVHTKQKQKRAAAATSNNNDNNVVVNDDISSIWSANEEEKMPASPEREFSALAAMGAASPLAVQLSGGNVMEDGSSVPAMINFWETKEH